VPDHKVQEGEHLAMLAAQAGFAELKPLLDDPHNQAIAARRHPNILEPDETVFVPDRRPKTESVATGASHALTVRRLKAELRLKLAGFLGAKLDVARAEARIDGGSATPVTVGDDGAATVPIQPRSREVRLSVELKDEEARAIEWTCRAGARRAEHEPGALARLRNLGYYRVVEADRDPRERRSAIEEFQHEHQLPLSGELDAATIQKLIDVHGS
jgi:hypothetical protein